MVGCRLRRRGRNQCAATTTTGISTAVAAAVLCLASAVTGQVEFVPRNFSGVWNNLDFPAWGSAGTTQIRSVAGADYEADGFTPPGDDRPTAREVLTDVVLTSTAEVDTKSALFIAWGQLLTYDLALTNDNASEPFDVPCNAATVDGDGIDVWCPLGEASDDISFSRSDADLGVDGVRSPINYATSYLDLDFLYGRSEVEAEELRTMEGGLMNITDNGVPFQNADGTWLMADQRPAKYPVTFALHIVLLLEHNRCCVEVAPDNGFEDDEGIFQACRGWTIAVFQHITQNDFLIRLLGITLADLGLEMYLGSDASFSTVDEDNGDEDGDSGWGYRARHARHARSRRGRRLTYSADYNSSINAAADVFVVTAGGAALESAIPGTVRIVSEGYISEAEDNIELSSASADMAGLYARNDVGNIIRGAVLSPALTVGPYYSPVLSNLSPLFNLPVEAVQRGRDHGLPTYNDAREAYGLEPAASFSDVSPNDDDLASRLSDAYGGDVDLLDAVTGALAEGAQASSGGVFGDLLVAAWSDQLTRSIAGDRFYHLHYRSMESVSNTTLSDLVARVTTATDVPLSVFQIPTITVCDGDCDGSGDGIAVLSDNFQVLWEEVDNDQILITLEGRDLGNSGWMGIGWGGLTMALAEDFIICEVIDESTAECTDRAFTTLREVPPLDANGPTTLNVTALSVGDWTSVSFLRDRGAYDEEDYELGSDIDDKADTLVIYAYREGEGIGQHPNANRGAATINFATGLVESECSSNDFVSLHGSLMLVAWMVLAPLGIYYVRYRKGETIKWAGFEWYEMHEEIMIVASEAVLPLGITAVFASGGNHQTSHAHWGYYMIAAVAVQIFTGWMRTKGLEAKHANFSFLHRFNKHFHIWAGRFAYLAGVVQCYRGLELASTDEDLILSAGDGLDLELGNYGWVKDQAFPIWFGIIALSYAYFETRKQYRRYFKKGAANLCGCVELINEEYLPSKDTDDDDDGFDDRLVPRTEALPIYTVSEFNEKVLHGQSWVLVDGAILDVKEFSHRHPGGARLILNALGTDVTHELLGEELSVGHAMSFSPHKHPESAWEIVRSLVVGYIEEEDEEDEEGDGNEGAGDGKGGGGDAKEGATQNADGAAPKDKNRAFRIAGKAVLLQARKAAITGDVKTAKVSELSALPEKTVPATAGTAGGSTLGLSQKGLALGQSPGPKTMQLKRAWSSKTLLERFHVCPLLFREKMDGTASLSRGQIQTKRPVYRYIFSCPGQAKALVEAINGVCYFNMRGQDVGKGVIQRSYNAYAVRVQGLTDPGTPGGSLGVGAGGQTPRIVPAGESSEGMLCIEMRIRLYHDGAMSQLLEKLAHDTDNPAVQLQGPFIINKLIPPPAHRNVIMIAAGTGINPMVQQIRDYLALPSNTSTSRSRLSLVWQSASETELYGSDEITTLQAKSNGLLEVTVLVSGDHRRRNVPGAAFRRGRKRFMNKAREVISPVIGSPSSSVVAVPGGAGRSPRDELDFDSPGSAGAAGNQGQKGSAISEGIAGGDRGRRRLDQKSGGAAANPWDDVQSSKFGPHPMRLPPTRESKVPKRKPRDHRHALPHVSADESGGTITYGGLIRGKVTREVLDKAFGSTVLAFLAEYDRKQSQFADSPRVFRGDAGVARAPGLGEAKSEEEGTADIDALAGTDSVAGKLQVVVSGSSGFVFYVETILAEMGVPSGALVLLD